MERGRRLSGPLSLVLVLEDIRIAIVLSMHSVESKDA